VKVNAVKGGTLFEQSYDDLLQADFVSTHQNTGKKVYFSILFGTKGALRGTPVQIRYSPNWWFQVVLNLLPKSGTTSHRDCTRTPGLAASVSLHCRYKSHLNRCFAANTSLL
jgi:hypothetical protein